MLMSSRIVYVFMMLPFFVLQAQNTSFSVVLQRPQTKVYDSKMVGDQVVLCGSTGSCAVASLDLVSADGQLVWSVTHPESGFSHYAKVAVNEAQQIVVAGYNRLADDLISLDDGIILACYNLQGQLLWNREYVLPFLGDRPVSLSCLPGGRLAVAGGSQLFLLNEQGALLEQWGDFGEIQYMDVLNDSLLAVVDDNYLGVFHTEQGNISWQYPQAVDAGNIICTGGHIYWSDNFHWRKYKAGDMVSQPLGANIPCGIMPRKMGNQLAFLKASPSEEYQIWHFNPSIEQCTFAGLLYTGERHFTNWTAHPETPVFIGEEYLYDPSLSAAYAAKGQQGGLDLNSGYDLGIASADIAVFDSTATTGTPFSLPQQAVRISVTVQNNGSQPVNSFCLASNQFDHFNCQELRFFQNVDLPSGIAAGEQRMVSFSFLLHDSHFDPGDPFCLFTFAPNQSIDSHTSNDDYCAFVVSAEEPSAAAAVRVYPNPARDYVDITTTTLPVTSAALYDFTGRCVRRFSWESGIADNHIPLTGFAAGIYQLTLQLSDGSQFVQKLVIH